MFALIVRFIDEKFMPVLDTERITQNCKLSDDGKPNLSLSRREIDSKEWYCLLLIVDKGNRSQARMI